MGRVADRFGGEQGLTRIGGIRRNGDDLRGIG